MFYYAGIPCKLESSPCSPISCLRCESSVDNKHRWEDMATSALLLAVPLVLILWDALVLGLVGRGIHFSSLKMAGFLFIENDNCVSQDSGSSEWRKCQNKFSFCVSSHLNLDIVSKRSTVQPSGPRKFWKGWEAAQVHWTVNNQMQFNQWRVLSILAGGPFILFLPCPYFFGHAVWLIIRSRDWTPRFWPQFNLTNYCSKCTISCPPAVFFLNFFLTVITHRRQKCPVFGV